VAVRHTEHLTYDLPQHALDESRAFLYTRGLVGCEGTGLWVGRQEGSFVTITRLFVPEQICVRTEEGVAVYLTEKAHYTLTDNLGENERFYARIHSHPTRAYHSEVDDANAVISHQGAISIVVPDFAAEPIDLARCAVYRLEHGRGWLRLRPDDIARIFRIIP
jgi:hypothetical protein